MSMCRSGSRNLKQYEDEKGRRRIAKVGVTLRHKARMKKCPLWQPVNAIGSNKCRAY